MTTRERNSAYLANRALVVLASLVKRLAVSLAPAWVVLAGGLLELGFFLFVGVTYFRSFWLSPSLVPDRWSHVADIPRALFPASWRNADKFSDQGFANLVIFVGSLAFLFLIYGSVLLCLRRTSLVKRAGLRQILIFTALFSVPLWLMGGLLSGDIFSYVFYAKMIAVYHANPLVFIPSDFVGDSFLQWVAWKDTQSVYGPAWLLLSTLMSYASGDDIVTHVLVFKASAIVFHLANTILIWVILGRVNPERRVFGTLLYAWNPLVLIEFAGSGHNDAMMVFFLLLTVLSYTHRAKRLGWIWLAIAVVTKSAALIFVPAYAILLLRDHAELRRRAIVVAEGLGIILALVAIFYVPFWVGPQVVQYYLSLPPFRGYTNSVGEVIYLGLQRLLAAWPRTAGPNVPEISDNLVKLGGALVFLIFFASKTFTVKSISETISSWASVLFFYLVVFVAWFWPWYVVWLV
ncbi:MAG: hypothetical protein M1358_15305, partial [Chloroflexi bacterium]|nr:hypothetical protein [Chloroflexota bacterium]